MLPILAASRYSIETFYAFQNEVKIAEFKLIPCDTFLLGIACKALKGLI
jgi:hypothetical protein